MTVEGVNHLGRLNNLLATEDTALVGGREALRLTKRGTIDVRRIVAPVGKGTLSRAFALGEHRYLVKYAFYKTGGGSKPHGVF
jgi:hypothetical protein